MHLKYPKIVFLAIFLRSKNQLCFSCALQSLNQNPRSSILSLKEGAVLDSGSTLGFDVVSSRRRDGAAMDGPAQSRLTASKYFKTRASEQRTPAPAPLVFWSPDSKYRKTVILKSAAIRHIGSSWFRIRDQKLVRRPFLGVLAGTLSFFSKFS